MKSTSLLLVIFSAIILNSGCNAQEKSEEKNNLAYQPESVEVYYFHLTSRCLTCNAIESEARKSVEELYNGEVVFKAFNYQDELNADIIEKMDVKGQELFIISKKGKIDLTSQGFLYARTNPEKLKEIIKESIDPLL